MPKRKGNDNPALPLDLFAPSMSPPAASMLGTAPKKEQRTMPELPEDSPWARVYEKLVRGVQQFFKRAGVKRAVVGLSGGVDSALTLKIAVDALGPEYVTALILPEQGMTTQENIAHARGLAEFLSVHGEIIPINRFITDFSLLPWRPTELALANTKARIRAVILYNYANAHGACVLGTSNKSELVLGYFTKYGDGAVDVEVIGDLYKTEVWALADAIGLPLEIVHKKPTAELYFQQTDEGELGADYHTIDQVLMQLHLGADKLIEKGMDPVLVHNIFRLVEKNAHKTKLPPILKAH